MADSLVSIHKIDDITILTMDDGKANVFSSAMARRLHECFATLDAESGAVIVTGRPGMLSAGFDLKTIMAGDPAAIGHMVADTVRMAMDVLSFPRPVIGLATGHCVAMGALFLMTMDYRFGVRGAFKVGLNEVRDGLQLPIFAVELARYRLPTASLIASTLHATLHDPDGAVHAGFLDEVVPAETALDVAVARARQFAKLPNPAYAQSKANLLAPVRDHILRTLEVDLGLA